MRKSFALKYWFSYAVSNKEQGFSCDDVVNDQKEGFEVSASDALLIAKIYRENGKVSSVGLVSADGENNGLPISSDDLFDVYFKLSEMFKYRDNLPEWKKQIALEAFEKINNKINKEK